MELRRSKQERKTCLVQDKAVQNTEVTSCSAVKKITGKGYMTE